MMESRKERIGVMKWSEFKQFIDKELKEMGVEDPDIWYIDISFPVKDHLGVGVDKHSGLCVG